MGKIKEYVVSDEDVIAIKRLIELGKESASISRDSVNFEAGILSEGILPVAYGSGDTIADAINEAIGEPHNNADERVPLVTQNQVEQAMSWLNDHKIDSVTR